MIKGKKLNIFVRFGGLNLKKQRGYGKRKSYHAPPAPRGIYCMPLIAQEMFLISSMNTYQPGTMPESKSSFEEKDWIKHEKKCKSNLSKMRKQFFRDKGNIWHHLINYVERNEIIQENGSWCKTSIKAWQKAFVKMSLEHRYGEKTEYHDFSEKSINNTKGIVGFYSKDHCEVFFDEKI